ncbi:MAG TPA: carbohydrate kinase [Rhodothermales bacterium]|nr:carbohydrate kinase [Rhodothermales bacterium]
MANLIVGLGEVLWDIFADERRLGGAPANVAYHAAVLGSESVVASRVGDDDLGADLTVQLSGKGVDTARIQTDTSHPTGTVEVSFVEGDPRYEIVRDVAWDFLEWTADWENLAGNCSAVCFSTLAQRSPASRATIERFLDATAPDCLRVLDVNLRPPFVNGDILRSSIERANVVKYNHQERLYLERLFWKDNIERWLCHEAGVDVVCMTRGAAGCDLFTRDSRASVDARKIETSGGDPVGAGDAFSAALIDGLLKRLALQDVARRANHYAGMVAARRGGMPEMPSLHELGL